VVGARLAMALASEMLQSTAAAVSNPRWRDVDARRMRVG
jgi:hypothetical protein